MNWTQELPQEPGTYLWVCMWGCPCYCYRRVGIVEVLPETAIDDGQIMYRNRTGKLLKAVYCGGQPPEIYEGAWRFNSIVKICQCPEQHFSDESNNPARHGAKHPVEVLEPDIDGYHYRSACNRCGQFVALVPEQHACKVGESICVG